MTQKDLLEFRIIPQTCRSYLRALEEKFLIIKQIEDEVLNPRKRLDKRRYENKGYFEQIEFLEDLSEMDLEHLPIYEKTKELVSSHFYFNMILVYFISVWEAFNDDLLEKVSAAFSNLNYDIQQFNLIRKLDKFLPKILKFFSEICILKEFYHRRNSIVHNNGRLDQKYYNNSKALLKYLNVKPSIDSETHEFLTKYKDIEYLYETLDIYIKIIYEKTLDYVRKNK